METPKSSNGALALIDDIIKKAVELSASDIHLEPRDNHLKVRYRVDGLLSDGINVHRSMQEAAVSRIKIMVNLDIAEKRLPQDGRTHLKVCGKDLDLRISTVPTIYGEKVVIRILEASSALLSLENLGMTPSDLTLYKDILSRPYGMILSTGPTGSGKTTTLYSSLNQIKSSKINIVTIEDPVEYELPGITQMHVNYKTGLTFVRGLRAILRQDPDVIMVGEIRDVETARVAIQGALTGHLVFSTLHTNDSASAVVRLLEMGIEPYLLNSTLLCVIAQRLARTLCRICKGRGCKNCNFEGYKGRIGIYEILKITDNIRKLISNATSTSALKEEAKKAGMRDLLSNGAALIKEGITKEEEIMRILYLPE